MRFPAAILIAACALAAGCTSLASRTRDRDRDPAGDRRPPARDPDHPWWTEGAADAIGRSKTKPIPDEIARTKRETIIAGVVVDSNEGRPLKGVTFVQVRPADEAAPASGKGLGFETDADGYFIVPGLIPGKTYILSVVREVDGRKVAGETQVKPPAGNIRLEIGDDRLSSTTPPLPPPPGMGPFERRGDAAAIRPPPGDASAGDRGWEPGTSPPSVAPPLPPPPEPVPSGRENIAGNPSLPPTAAIRPPPPPATGPAPGPSPPVEPPVTRAPGQRVPNFVVNDVMGSDWEFRQANGRLILVEFWSTTCVPCQRAMPAMKRLQADYGESGLEIVAIACEADAPFNTRARAVDDVARRKELNYRVYLERDGHVGEVQRLFNVQWVPTLVLLDRNGTVLWRGGATDTDMTRVNDVVKEYLTRR